MADGWNAAAPWVPTVAGMDWERAFIQRKGKPAGNIAAGQRLLRQGPRGGGLQGVGVSTHLAQTPPQTRVLAPRQGSAAYPVSDIQIQPPGSWDVLCPCPLAGEGLLVQARLCSVGQSRRVSFPNT